MKANTINREGTFSHNMARCLSCMHSSLVGTGRDRSRSSSQVKDGEWIRLTPVPETKVDIAHILPHAVSVILTQDAPLRNTSGCKSSLNSHTSYYLFTTTMANNHLFYEVLFLVTKQKRSISLSHLTSLFFPRPQCTLHFRQVAFQFEKKIFKNKTDN